MGYHFSCLLRAYTELSPRGLRLLVISFCCNGYYRQPISIALIGASYRFTIGEVYPELSSVLAVKRLRVYLENITICQFGFYRLTEGRVRFVLRVLHINHHLSTRFIRTLTTLEIDFIGNQIASVT